MTARRRLRRRGRPAGRLSGASPAPSRRALRLASAARSRSRRSTGSFAALAAGEIDVAVLPAATRGAGPVLEPLEALARALDGGPRLVVAVRDRGPGPARPRRAARRRAGGREGDPLAAAGLPAVRAAPRAARRVAGRDARHGATRRGASRSSGGRAPRSAPRRPRSRRASSSSRRTSRTSGRTRRASGPWFERRPDVEPAVRALLLRRDAPRGGAHRGRRRDPHAARPSGRAAARVRGRASRARSRRRRRSRRGAGETLVWLGPTPDHVPAAAPPRACRARRRSGRSRSSRSAGFAVGGGRRAVIAGPCAVESPEQVMRLAKAVARAGATALRGGVFKPRTSPYAFQGHGLEALDWLQGGGRRRRPPDRHGGHGAGARSSRSPSSPTFSRSARATARTTTS